MIQGSKGQTKKSELQFFFPNKYPEKKGDQGCLLSKTFLKCRQAERNFKTISAKKKNYICLLKNCQSINQNILKI
jgi:hypothetical protein